MQVRINISSLNYSAPCSRDQLEKLDDCVDSLTTKRFLVRKEIWTPDVIQRVVTLAVIMVATVLGNFIVLVLLCCYGRYRRRHSRVSIFIVNLAIGDLSVCVWTMTSEILFVAFGDWVLGNAGCKLITYGQIVTLAATTFILTSMSFDRYVAICKPLRLDTTDKRAKKMIALSWTLAFVFAIPQLIIFQETDEGMYADGRVRHYCKTVYQATWQRKTYFTFLTSYILVIPAVLISFFYIRVAFVVWKQGQTFSAKNQQGLGLRRVVVNKKLFPKAKIRTLLMTFAIIATFISCWTPYFVTTLIRVYTNNSYDIKEPVIVLAETTPLLPSALNPILYGLFNLKLASTLTARLCCCLSAIPSPFGPKRSEIARQTESLMVSVGNVADARFLDKFPVHSPGDTFSNTSSGSRERSRVNAIVTEQNVDGIRLRVRFTSRDNSQHSHSYSQSEEDYKITSL